MKPQMQTDAQRSYKSHSPIRVNRCASLVPSLLLAGAAIIAVLPLVWLVCASFKSGGDLFQYPLLSWGHLNHLSVSNYARLFTGQPFGPWMLSSIFLASTQTVASVLLASLGGFAVAKYHFRGRRMILGILLSVMLLPYQVLLPSSYELMHCLGWLDSYWAILVPGAIKIGRAHV